MIRAVWFKVVAVAVLCVVSLLGQTRSAAAAVIDTFIDGTIVTPIFPQIVIQSGLVGVIGSGDREVRWQVNQPPGEIVLNLDNLVPGSALLSYNDLSVADWLFSYGRHTPLDLDLTAGGLGDSFTLKFTTADPGLAATLLFYAIDQDGDQVTSGNLPIPSWPSGGILTAPLNVLNPGVDLTHVKEVGFFITAYGGTAAFEIEYFSTLVVPEPSSLCLLGLGLAALAVQRRRR